MKKLAIAVFTVALTTMIFTGLVRAECLKYDTKATLTGTVTERIGYGEPRNETGRVRYHALVLDKPLCFDSDEDYPAEKGVRTLQLMVGPWEFCKQYPGKNCDARFIDDFSKRYNGKRVQVSGQPFHAILAWHHTTVLIDVKSIDQLPAAGVSTSH
jgi:hypothetical protein